MQFDVQAHLGAIERTVSAPERDGKEARAVTMSRTFPTPVADLWDAVTNPERIVKWFAPVSGTLEPGGRFDIEGNASGDIVACERHSRISLTWEFQGVSWVEAEVADAGEGSARLTLSHIAPMSDFWEQYGPGAAGVGWEMALVGLALYLTQPDFSQPDDAAFAASPDGRAFFLGSSEGWRKAAVAGGEDPEAALAAAKRTTAFYSGQPAESA